MSKLARLPNPVYEDIGLNGWGERQIIPVDVDTEIVQTDQTFADNGIQGFKIDSLSVNKLTAGSLRVDSYIQSTDYVAGVSGWRISGDGDAEFDDGTFRGTIDADSGTIGGFTIGATTLSAVSGGNTTTLSSGSTAFAAGPTGSPTVTITQAGVLTAAGAVINGSGLNNQEIFGDGSDGTVTISGDTTLARDMFYDVLTINSGINLNSAGYRIFCKTSATINGTLRNNGGTGGAGSVGGTPGGGAGGTAGTGGAGATLTSGKAGASGGAGGNGAFTGNGFTPSPATAGSAGTALSAGGVTGAGQAGVAGASQAVAGGAGGAAGAYTAAVTSPRVSPFLNLCGYFLPDTGTFVAFNSRSGNGGSGGGSGASGSNDTNGGGGGGAGSGGQAGQVFIAAKLLTIGAAGVIQANGGAGGAGGNGGPAISGMLANGGSAGAGGDGGNGGLVFTIYSSISNSGTIQAAGGAGGAAGTGGTGVNGGFTGNSSSAGTAGLAGTVITIVV